MNKYTEVAIFNYKKGVEGKIVSLKNEVNVINDRIKVLDLKLNNTKEKEEDCNLFVDIFGEDLISKYIEEFGYYKLSIYGNCLGIISDFSMLGVCFFFDYEYTKEQKIDILNSLKYIFKIKNFEEINKLSSSSFDEGEFVIQCDRGGSGDVFHMYNFVVGENDNLSEKSLRKYCKNQEGTCYIKVSDILKEIKV